MMIKTAAGETCHFVVFDSYACKEAVEFGLAHCLGESIWFLQTQRLRNIAVEVVEVFRAASVEHYTDVVVGMRQISMCCHVLVFFFAESSVCSGVHKSVEFCEIIDFNLDNPSVERVVVDEFRIVDEFFVDFDYLA